jgi:opacity protein-like surface antigen
MKHLCLIAALLSLSVAAAAEGLDYSYVQGSYSQVEFDDIDVDGDGFGIAGSFAIGDRFAVIAGYDVADYDFGLDTTAYEIGGLFHAPLTDRGDFVGTLSYVSLEVDVPNFGSVDDDGFGVGAGLRGMASPKVELNGGISYVDFSDGGDDTTFGAGVRYHFTDAVSAGLDGSWGDDTSAYGISGRIAFGEW